MAATKKRKWSSAELSLHSTHHPELGPGTPLASAIDVQQSPMSTNDSATPPLPKVPEESHLVSVVTRKSTACPACRKQKVGGMTVATSSPLDCIDVYVDQMCYGK